MKLCKCGCGKEIKTRSFHKYCGIPKFIHGHNHKGKTYEEIYGSRVKEQKEKRKNSLVGKSREDMKGNKNVSKRIEVREKIRKSITLSWKNNFNMRKEITTKISKLWKDSNSVYHTEDYWKKRAVGENLKPNKCEAKIQKVLDNVYPSEWKYVGDYSFWVNGKNPDFTCINGKKLLIEHFGTYYHQGEDPEERKKIFSEFGYKTLVIWEHELKDMKNVEIKIKKFIEVNIC